MVIAHNLRAMNSQRQLSITSGTVSKKSEKLSSGYKINRAADDAAGLSISEKMRRQIRGLTQATENAEDGISMVQIADGALNEVQEMLQRMNELCVQAANGTNAQNDRLYIQDEVTQLRTEIDRVAQTTKFNETYLLDGSLANGGRGAYMSMLDNRKIDAAISKYERDKAKVLEDLEKKRQEREEQGYSIRALTGENAGQTVTAEELAAMEGVKIVYIRDEVKTNQIIPSDAVTTAGYSALKNVLRNEIVPNAVLAIMDAYAPAYDFLENSSIGMGLKLYSDASNTLAYVGLTTYTNSGNKTMMSSLDYQLAVNLNALTMTDVNGTLDNVSRNKLEVTIVHEMMHAFMDEALTNGMVGSLNGNQNQNANGFPKWFIEGMAQTAAGGYYDNNDWVNGGLGITTGSSIDNIKTALTNNPIGGSSDKSNYGTGYLACMYLGYLAGGKASDPAKIKEGLGTILKEIRGGDSLQKVIKKWTGKDTIVDFQNSFANDGSEFVKNLTAIVGEGTGGVVGGLTTKDDILKNVDNSSVKLFELNTENDKVHNTYEGGYDVWAGGTGTEDGNPGSTTPTGGTEPWGPTNPVDPPTPGPTPAPFPAPQTPDPGTPDPGTPDPDPPADTPTNKSSSKGMGAALHVGADADMTNKIMLYIDAMDSESIGVDKVDVRTVDLATISIKRVELALARVSAQRSELGAVQNRLEHTIKNLDNVVENTTAAESLIRDTDMASEMVAYSNVSILQQAGQSMLAQMNQSNQGVLSLVAS